MRYARRGPCVSAPRGPLGHEESCAHARARPFTHPRLTAPDPCVP